MTQPEKVTFQLDIPVYVEEVFDSIEEEYVEPEHLDQIVNEAYSHLYEAPAFDWVNDEAIEVMSIKQATTMGPRVEYDRYHDDRIVWVRQIADGSLHEWKFHIDGDVVYPDDYIEDDVTRTLYYEDVPEMVAVLLENEGYTVEQPQP